MDSIISNIMIAVAMLTLLATAVITALSVTHSLRVNKRPKVENGVPTRTISLSTIGLLLAIALPTLFIGSLTDMCIITALVLLTVASGLVTYGRIQTLKRVRNK